MPLPLGLEYGARPRPRRCTRRRGGGAASRTGHPASRLRGTSARPCPASQSPSRAPHRLHCRRRPLAAFTLEARRGRGRPRPRPVPRRHFRLRQNKRQRGRKARGSLFRRGRAWEASSPGSSRTARIGLTARVTGRSHLYLKCSLFICRLKTNLEEAKSKTCPLPLAT